MEAEIVVVCLQVPRIAGKHYTLQDRHEKDSPLGSPESTTLLTP
jgi:hypothetical protein